MRSNTVESVMGRKLVESFNESQQPFFTVNDSHPELKESMSQLDLSKIFKQSPGFHLDKIDESTYIELSQQVGFIMGDVDHVFQLSVQAKENLIQAERFAVMDQTFRSGITMEVFLPGSNVQALLEWIPRFFNKVPRYPQCELRGLSRAEFNGKKGLLMSYQSDKERFVIRVGKSNVSIKPENVMMLVHQELAVIVGLSERKNLNGKVVAIKDKQEGGRLSTRSIFEPSKHYSVKEDNLKMLKTARP